MSDNAELQTVAKTFEAFFSKLGVAPTNISTLWHYTTFTSFQKIIESGTIRASEMSFLNDSTEYWHVNQVLHAVLKRLRSSRPDLMGLIDLVLNGMPPENYRNTVQIYTFCMCAYGDLLSQWRAYGAHGNGVSIGFDIQEMRGIIKPPYNLNPCGYLSESGAEIEDLCEKMLNDLRVEINKNGAEYFNKFMRELLMLIKIRAPFMKNIGFFEENEWRLAYFGGGIDSVDDEIFFAREHCFSVARSLNVKTESGLLPISKVIIGPSDFSNRSRQVVDEFLNRNNYSDVDVRVSNLPYRMLS